MKSDRKEWDFHALMWEYFELNFYFESIKPWESYPEYTQIRLKKFVAVLNAITDGKYVVETVIGKNKISSDFYNGFGLEFALYTEVQANQLKEILKCSNLFKYLGQMCLPYVGSFYNKLFAVYEAGYKYLTCFDFVDNEIKRSDVFKIVDEFKVQKQDKRIYEKNRVIAKCMTIILGKKFERTFTTGELIEKHNYPDVEYGEFGAVKVVCK